MRREIERLAALGPLPAEDDVTQDVLRSYQDLLTAVRRPLTDDEARAVTKLFGPDECFGLAWTLVHLVESAPGWPIRECLEGPDMGWIRTLRLRVERRGSK